MSFLSKAFRRKPDALPPWAALDQESLRISAAMEHLQDHGNLDAFPGSQNERLALMLTASRQGLVTWDRSGERYELTSLGRERLGMRRVLQEPGAPMNLPPPSAGRAGPFLALGSGTILAGIAGIAIGAAAVALLPGSSSKPPPRDRTAVATAPKPSDGGNTPPRAQTQGQAPAPRQEEASGARNPGIPCLAEKCLETGGTAARTPQQAGPPQQARNAAPASPKPEPPKADPQQAGLHPGQAGAVEGAVLAQQLALAAAEPAPTAETNPAPAPKSSRPRRSAERARTYQAAPPADQAAPPADQQPGYAQSTGEPSPRAAGPAGAAEKSSRNRHAATGQRQGWSESKRKAGKSRRDYAEEQAGEPEQDMIVRRYPERDDGPPPFVTRRYRGEQARRRGADEEDRPGYAYREPQGYGYREGPPRFGVFDWLFR